MNEVFIVRAKRTVIGQKRGLLANNRPEKLAAMVFHHLTDGIPFEQIDGVILGNAVGEGGNIARLSLLEAGLSMSIPGTTIDGQCGSGLDAIITAARQIQVGAGEVYIAGGTESTSLEPERIPTNGLAPLTRARFSPETIGDPDMAVAAENVATLYGISREQQDAYAARSYERAYIAEQEGRFRQEKIYEHRYLADEGIRKVSERLLKRMPSISNQAGSVTAINSCAKSDGAAAVLLMSKEACERLGFDPILTFIDGASAGCDPNLASFSPVPAIRKLLDRQKLRLDQVDLVEWNEAYAAQMVACSQELNLDASKLNRSGGALTLGHPYGASGAINVVRLVHEMSSSGAKIGLSAVGAAGGNGTAALFYKSDV
ncbi:acetyl-CoA C-acyltransferase [Shouchella patagoniensis]|uniref:acetyl-CoA C-acyltransferase n=1 Tax=Shouchella patagoniensis TaxID=228576 RepID=UPI0009949788|nr:acetyl-CoA C-acyltransferase [Shouchella patagoniensis]